MSTFLDISPTLNTALQATSGLLVLIGYMQIRRGREELHKRYMLAATAFAALFLIAYVTRWALVGNVPFQGQGWIRPVYFVILFSHVLLAMFQVPLALIAIRDGLLGRHARHRRLARILYPVWLYVSVTGIIVYILLYQIDWTAH